jgi:hypothetical protein
MNGTMGIIRSRDPTIDSVILEIENKRLTAELSIAQKTIPAMNIKIKDSISFQTQSDQLIRRSIEIRKSGEEKDMKEVLEQVKEYARIVIAKKQSQLEQLYATLTKVCTVLVTNK